ncbi:MAG: MG2 domain-containing protein, partial [Pseudomonadota bacterium]|nr:MG2 domain-containing protein [Pseudomonadota bacterium]
GLAISAEDAQLCVNGVQHGERYHITLRAGLPGTSGEVLQKDVTLTQYVRDRDPVVRFPGRAYVLHATGSPSIPIVTVNTDRVDLRIRRVAERNLLRAVQDQYFGRPLSPWQEDSFAGTVAEDIWTGTGEVANSINAETTTRLPLEQALAGLPAGIYVLQASVPDTDPYDVAPATQWFVISDLGFSTLQGNDGLHVFARSLADTTPRAGVEVSVLSRSNRVLATDVTDADGYLNVQPGFLAGTGGAEPALIVLRDGESDISFMSLTDPAFDLSDRGVTGRAPPEPIDVFLTTDRGAYRAGETIYATALARDPAVVAQTDVPLTAILRRPDGVEYARVRSDGAALGGH